LGLGVRLNSNDGSNGCDIGDLRWSCVVAILTGMMWSVTGAPETLLAVLKAMGPWAIPPIGISMGVVIFRVSWIWVGLGAQGV
jgi:hypothetical protein